MAALINIGLFTSACTGTRPVSVPLAIACVSGLNVREAYVHTSDTEPTLVVHVDVMPSADALAEWSKALKQDCIAAFDFATGEGLLAGPKADAWGPFNPEYFLTLSGTRLDQAMAMVCNIS